MSAWIANLPLRHKFVLLCLLAVLMAGAPTVLVLRTAAAKLGAVEQERTGMEPSRDLLAVIKLMQEHRGMSNAFLSGDASKKGDLAARRAGLDKALGEAVHSVATLEHAPTAASLQALQADWTALGADVAKGALTPPESVRRHTALVVRSLLLLEDVGAVSGLSLDPDAESYFLIQAAFRDLPRLTEQLGLARARGTGMLVRGASTPDERQTLQALKSMALSHATDAQRNLARATAARDGEAVPEFVRATEQAEAAVKRGMALVDRVSGSETLPDMAGSDYFQATTEVITAQFAVSEQALKRLDTLFDRRIRQDQTGLALIGAITLLALSLGVWVSVAVTRETTRTVQDAMQVAQALAAGDLTRTLRSRSRDEVGQMVDAMAQAIEQLKATIFGIKAASDSVATASSQIAQGNLDLSARTENQASSLQQTASSMEEMSATVKQNASTAAQANELATAASREATQGGEVFGQVVAKMAEIKQTSTRIAEINAVIDGIAFQTNILALNAAVEAARAGEQGRGFAVVAGEVRTLAQRSAQAAREIKSLISSSVESVEQGYDLASHSSESIERLIGQVQKVSQLMAEIASASEQQSLGIVQVNQAVSLLDQTTQQNAALVEESSAAASSLSDQAMRLQQAVGRFTLA
ncbi:methyl-accepting chemotaxis protein [Aquabacterium olei]|uniref:Methyl-accepting chemotaxis protein n=1 Tax=Aquabacterium olei TaxID=1296669 RepID=A0A2U8FN74_9BURK|nr:methyl-accepting chemotaxis protein [Aquabacterium olei]AWI52423.1 methyl-accepting chemotaxis protein [Aquabacterium olei]